MNLLSSEWIKLRSTRSTYWTVLAAAAFALGIGVAVSRQYAHSWPTMTPAARADFDPVWSSLQGFGLVQVILGMLGVLVVSAEYATGMIRTTVTAVPRRTALVAAKTVVYAIFSVVVGSALVLLSFLAGQAILHGRHLGVSLFAPGVADSLAGAVYYLAVIAGLAVALGTLLRRTAAAGVVLFAVVFLIPQLANALPAPWDSRIGRWMLPNAGEQLVLLHPSQAGLTPAVAAWLCLGYAVLPLLVAGWLIQRRDV